MRSYWSTIKGAVSQNLARHVLSLKSLQLGSLSLETRNPDSPVTVMRRTHLMYIPLQSWSRSRCIVRFRMGSKPLALPEALKSSTRSKTDLMSTASMDLVSYCQVCLHRTHQPSKCPPISNADKIIGTKRMLALTKTIWITEEISETRGPQRENGTQKNPPWSPPQSKTNSSNSPLRRLKSLINETVRSGPPSSNRHCQLPSSCLHQKTAGKLKTEDPKKAFLGNICES